MAHSSPASLATENLKEVYSKAYKARGKWSNILLALNVDNATIETIGMAHRESPDDCFRTGLSRWLSSGSGNWKDLVEALSDPTVGHQDIADSIEKEYLHGGESYIAIH